MSAGASIKNDSGRTAPASILRPYGSTYLWLVNGVTYKQNTPGVGNGWISESGLEEDPIFTTHPANNVIDTGSTTKFLSAAGTYNSIVIPEALEIDSATIVGYVDTVNGNDANDGLTEDTAKQTLAGCSGLPAGRIYAFGTGIYNNSIKLSYRQLTDPARNWYFETGATLNQTTVSFLGDPGTFDNFFEDVVLAIEGNATIRYAGNASPMIDSSTTFSSQLDITCFSYQYLPSGGSYPDANLLNSEGFDFLTINATNQVGYLGNADVTNSFIHVNEPDPLLGKFGDVVVLNDRGKGGAQCSSRNATFYKITSDINGIGDNDATFDLNMGVIHQTFGVEFVRGMSDAAMLFNFNKEFTDLAAAIIICAGAGSATININEGIQDFLGHVDINRGTCFMENVVWTPYSLPFNYKILCRTVGRLFIDHCEFNGDDGAIEAVDVGCTLEIKQSLIRAAVGNAVDTETTATRIWATALIAPAGNSVDSTTVGLAITMDQCIGETALNANITDTIGNFLANAGWAGL